jgi:hypothetical protein
MTETAQPATAAESEVAADPIAEAANAFKAQLGQIAPPERPRDEQGRFASAQPEAEEEIEAEAQAEAESQETEETDEAAEEAQPEAVDLPPSWPSEHAETWQSLPPETQALIVEREGQREAAVNAKFQEAANVRKANEAVIAEAQQSAQKFVEVADVLTNMLQPQRPSQSMLMPGSHDYNPDHYHLLNAQADDAERLLSQVKQQRETALAQLQRDQEARALEEITQIEARARPALLKDVPELEDAHKQPQILGAIVQYAVENGIPAEVFTDPEQAKYVTSAQLHMAWKAQQYDKMKKAQGKVQPKAAKPAAPVVRPGVTTSATQQKSIQRKNIQERLTREGSVEAGAAFFKSLKF